MTEEVCAMNPATPTPIADFVRYCGTQQKAADALGISRATVATWLRRQTGIFVFAGPSGGFTWYQVRIPDTAA